jgi:glycosyltransferase involved in cell wall biosynthesis
MELITVVLQTYNHEATLAKALDSILEQKTNFEFCIHVIEDFSTDGTANICRDYQQRFPDKIKLFLNDTNKGFIKNLKAGLDRVTAPYIAFLDGDDYWCDPQKLQLQFDAMEAHPECMMCGHNVLFKDHLKKIEYPFIEKEPSSESHVYTLADKLFIHTSARLYRNTIDIKNLPDNMIIDVHMYNLYLTQGSLYYIDRIMSVYNRTGEGFWSSKSPRDKRLTNLAWHYEANQYFNYNYEANSFKTSRLLKTLKCLLGVKRGWAAFYYLETARIYIKFFFKK